MRLFIVGLLLLTTACRRPSQQFQSMLTPADTPTIADYSQYLKAGDELIAMGNEPAWSLRINPSKNTMLFKAMNGDSVNAPLPARQVDPNGFLRYQAEAKSGLITVLFRPDSCVDSMTGQRFEYAVQASINGKNYTGCGTSLRQLALLQDIWVLTDFRGSPIRPETFPRDKPRIEFSITEGRVTGTTGCNQFSGPVKADSRYVSFGPLVTTRMACLGETGTFEPQFLAEMNTPFTYQIADRTLTLIRAQKPVMVFKKVD